MYILKMIAKTTTMVTDLNTLDDVHVHLYLDRFPEFPMKHPKYASRLGAGGIFREVIWGGVWNAI